MDSIWQFTLQDVKINGLQEPLVSDMIQIVAIDHDLNPYIQNNEPTVNKNKRKRKK